LKITSQPAASRVTKNSARKECCIRPIDTTQWC
jgi:hypothetical protein